MLVGDSVGEVDLERADRGWPVVGLFPARLGVVDREVYQFRRGLFVWEAAAGFDAFADLAVEALDAVRRVDRSAQVCGQREGRGDVLPFRAPRRGDHGVLLAPSLVEAIKGELGGFRVPRRIDRPEAGGDGFAVAVRDVAHPGTDLVNDARLDPGLREDSLDRLGEPFEAVDAADQDVFDAALVEIVEDGQPEFRALALAPPQAEDFAGALQRDADREVAGPVLDRAVLTDLHAQGV